MNIRESPFITLLSETRPHFMKDIRTVYAASAVADPLEHRPMMAVLFFVVTSIINGLPSREWILLRWMCPLGIDLI